MTLLIMGVVSWGLVAFIVALNVWHHRYRASLTAEERRREDEEWWP